MGGEGSMSHANNSLRGNGRLRRHGKGIFDKKEQGYAFHARKEGSNIPSAPPEVVARFREEAAREQKRERAKWVWTFAILIALFTTGYFLEEILEVLSG
ncbi:hypothetical protein [Lewinella sp. 4G2]|uniref:hypothetical protein n=1 Tax=Lewinella sp. 4G2 TaxID=1803372 RepID=UPI0007B4BED7|nr:hypothetical protein [Lewinella sp. 4G2]OAV43839.1 hypothetical protein A3850_004695 [Lewinella sp. 4G2]